MGISYFYTTNATRLYRAGRYSFSFEHLTFISGSWDGILQVNNPDHADALRDFGPPIREITKKEYDDLKKKSTNTLPASRSQEPENREPEPETGDAPLVVEKSEDVLVLGEADPDLAEQLAQ